MCKMLLKCLLLVVFSLSIREVRSSDKCMKASPSISNMVNSMGSRITEQIAGNDNYLISPLSITIALAMVYTGARGTTKEQMSEVLDLKGASQNCLPNKINEDFRQLILSFQNEDEKYSLLLANGMFVQTGCHISPNFSSNLKRFYSSNMQYLNFKEEETGTMDAINAWVSNHTKGKIAKLLHEPLDPMTIMILINAIYFKGIWHIEFEEEYTRKSIFHGLTNTNKSVQFMEMQETANYYLDPETESSFLELDYRGKNISMIIMLPKNREVPKDSLTSEQLCLLRNKFEQKTVSIRLPKFSIEFKRELSKDMMKLGMEELFSDKADLSGIRERGDLHVSLMVHKAVIEINEKGTVAAAISGIGIDSRRKNNDKEEFFANHPFLFYIIHRESNTILFSGRVVDL